MKSTSKDLMKQKKLEKIKILIVCVLILIFMGFMVLIAHYGIENTTARYICDVIIGIVCGIAFFNNLERDISVPLPDENGNFKGFKTIKESEYRARRKLDYWEE